MKDRKTPRRLEGQEGQSLAEYALILTFVAIACVAVLGLLGGRIGSFFVACAGSF